MVANNGKPAASVEAADTMKGSAMLKAVAQGLSITEAAKQVGVSRRHGGELYHAQLAHQMAQDAALRQHLIAVDLETLRLLVQAHMPAALGELAVIADDQVIHRTDGTEKLDGMLAWRSAPDTGSAKVVLSALDRRAKLLGLNATIQVEVSNSRINEVLDKIMEHLDDASDGEIAEVLQIERPAG